MHDGPTEFVTFREVGHASPAYLLGGNCTLTVLELFRTEVLAPDTFPWKVVSNESHTAEAVVAGGGMVVAVERQWVEAQRGGR